MLRRALIGLLALGLVALVQGGTILRQQHHAELLAAKANPRGAFAAWMAKHGKPYAQSNDLHAVEARFRNWQANLDFVLQYNAKHTSHWVGLNSLADLSHEEYRERYGLGAPRFKRVGSSSALIPGFKYDSLSLEDLPQSVDWREKGAVAEVKNQMACGSCWAFSTTGAIEGVNKIVTGKLQSLSEQFLVDCDRAQDQGCQGGLMDYAFEFVKNHGGIELEKDYPYTGEDGECQDEDDGLMQHVTIDGYQDVPQLNEIALKKAASQQPVSVAIEADQRAFQLYMGGVFDDKECGRDLDHGVLVVGYGVAAPSETAPDADEDADEDDDQELLRSRGYWIVKNSWGAGWGDKGYIKIRMGRGKAGLCGIATQPSYPVKTGPNPPPAPKPQPKPDPPGPKPPKPEPPGPVACDGGNECPPENTCCCLTNIGGFCFSWGCCPMPKATCCKDGQHCCPHDLPVCDTEGGRCLPPSASLGDPNVRSAPWAAKTKATRKHPELLYRGRGKVQGRGFVREAEDGAPVAASR